MIKELDYKVHDLDTRCIYNSNEIVLMYMDGKVTVDAYDLDTLYKKRIKNFELLPYCNKKDRHGKKLYLDDIVNIDILEEGKTIQATGYIHWNDFSFSVILLERRERILLEEVESKDIEVVGPLCSTNDTYTKILKKL